MSRPTARLLKRIALQVLLLLGVYFLSRCGFTLVNAASFSGLGIPAFLRLCFFALRYDLSAIFALNALYFFLLLLPLPVLWKPRPARLLQWLFVVINSIALLFEIADWAYFPYNFKRATADVLKMITRQGDFWSVLPSYLRSYWYIPLVCAALIYSFKKINDRICRATGLTYDKPVAIRVIAAQTAALLLVSGISLVAIRGGFQYIPIGLRNAVQITDSRYVPIVANTPFSIITTAGVQGRVEEVQYMPDAQAAALMPVIKHYSARVPGKKNVVVIILESFSKEFTALGGGTSYTPFLDSLMGRSLVCTNAYANGLYSAVGIPAVLAGIPTLMDEPFPTSNYGTNRITALPSVLKTAGYSSAFYHGGTNGTMSFDVFASAAGFGHYYGRKEYGNERDYDGAWGIWDEPFLQYFAHGLGQMQQPFVSTVFTLSSHPPYSIPVEYKGRLPKGTLPIHPCVAYTDMALRKFFQTASKQSWYGNTLFVITADHCSPQNSGGYWRTQLGHYAIPIIFYAPSDTALHGTFSDCAQQIDILPSVLDYLGWQRPFFAFGNSIFSPAPSRFAVNWLSDNYAWLQNRQLLQTHDVKPFAWYDVAADSACRRNLIRSYTDSVSLLRLKAFVQQYRAALIHNKMWAGQ